MSLGATGIFIILLILIILFKPDSDQDHSTIKQRINDAKVSIEKLKPQNKEREKKPNPVAPKEDSLLIDIVTDSRQRQEWKKILQLEQELKELKEIKSAFRKANNSDGVAHLSYRASPDSLSFAHQNTFLLEQELSLKPKEFIELASSISAYSTPTSRDRTFFILCSGDTPKWLARQFKEWDWGYIDVPLKANP